MADRILANGTCDRLLIRGAVPVSDPDISGIGVIIAFTLSAYLTFLISLGAYFGGLVDPALLGPVDKIVFRIKPWSGKQSVLHTAIEKAILTFSDQQIVTGIAILGAGFNGLREGKITVYHFQIVLYLAWMSSSVHLTALTLLRTYLTTHPGVKWWRMAGMLVLLLLLLCALVPTVSNDWGITNLNSMPPGNTGWAISAICFWGQTYGDGVNPDAVLGFVILTMSYLWKVGDIFPELREGYVKNMHNRMEALLLSLVRGPGRLFVQTGRRRHRILTYATLAFYLPVTAFLEVCSSFSATLWLAALGLVFGSLQIFIPRREYYPLVGQSDRSLSFGQLVPLILLIQPLGAVLEHLWIKDTDPDHDHDKSTSIRSPPSSSTITQSTAFLTIITESHARDRLTGDDFRHRIKTSLYRSRLFIALIWMIQLTILTTAVITFYFDSQIIGNSKASNWQFILLAVAASAGLGALSTAVLAPFSRLCRF